MKRVIVCLIFFLLFIQICYATDYSNPINWVINSNTKENTEYDIFYIYPTIFATEKTALFDWSDEQNSKKAKKYANAQTSIFNQKETRVFAPFVRQLDFVSILSYIDELKSSSNIDYHKTNAKYGIQDTIDALNYYLEHYNQGRPFILLGHSQGAIDLLFAMKEVDLGKNFLAAYLIGCPNTSKEFLRAKDTKLAQRKNDLGVIITWNSQKENTTNNYFSTPNGYVINPLNWRTDEKPASRFRNSKSEFYNYIDNTFTIKTHFTGAKVDKKNGVLLVDMPTKSRYDTEGLFGEGIYHTSDVWAFSNAISKNAEVRFRAYKKWLKKQEACKKYSNCELGDLVGEDVERLYFSGYHIDYHTEEFSKEQAKKFAKDCLNEGVLNQYQMDCCTTRKMYP
ncbi:MAG: DUF3089 domain-containing protein [bacterium]|nr:DUF3089 domain-containing protein [bacterium]